MSIVAALNFVQDLWPDILVRWTDKKSGKDRVRTGRVRLKTIPDASAESLLPFVRESVEKGAIVHTDGWPSYMALANEGHDHCPVIQGEEREYMYTESSRTLRSGYWVRTTGE